MRDGRLEARPGVVKMLQRGIEKPRANTYWAEGNTYLSDDYTWQALAFGEPRGPK